MPQEMIADQTHCDAPKSDKATLEPAALETAACKKAACEKTISENLVPVKASSDVADAGDVKPAGVNAENAGWAVAPLPERFSRTQIVRHYRVHRKPISLNRVVSFESDASMPANSSEVDLFKQGWGSRDNAVFAPVPSRSNALDAVGSSDDSAIGGACGGDSPSMTQSGPQYIARPDAATYVRLWHRVLDGTSTHGALRTVTEFDPNDQVWRIDESAVYNVPALRAIPSDAIAN
jgi:hypothetical protein